MPPTVPLTLCSYFQPLIIQTLNFYLLTFKLRSESHSFWKLSDGCDGGWSSGFVAAPGCSKQGVKGEKEPCPRVAASLGNTLWNTGL